MICSPNMSDDTGVLKMSPVNSHVVCLASIPDVPSNTYERSSWMLLQTVLHVWHENIINAIERKGQGCLSIS